MSGLGGPRPSACLVPQRGCWARVRGLLEFADVDSFLNTAEMLGGTLSRAESNHIFKEPK